MFFKFLPGLIRFFKGLQVSSRFCKVLQGSSRFCKILQSSARFCMQFDNFLDNLTKRAVTPRAPFSRFLYFTLLSGWWWVFVASRRWKREGGGETINTQVPHFPFFQFTFLFSLSVTYLLFHGI